MRSIINYFIKNQIAANLLMISILIFGYFGLQRMKSTFFPEKSLSPNQHPLGLSRCIARRN
ncbi:MAG: hypothetical protein HC912_07125 [Saprospiraceae bacterium]|nr:hypothetical protein [Saprospiraceae bacterium]